MSFPTFLRGEAPTATASAMRSADREAASRYGIEPLQLMEAAGLLTAHLVADLLPSKTEMSVAVVCGPGNNGGDGLVAARYLHQRGVRVRAFVIRSGSESLATRHLITLQALGVEPVDAETPAIEADLVVDALLGTGVRLPVRPREAGIIAAVNRAGGPVVAVDVPSGLDADTGAGIESCVQASATITLGMAKPGLIRSPAAGRLFLADIGLPTALFPGADAALRAVFARGPLVELI